MIVVHRGKLSIYIDRLRKVGEPDEPTHRIIARYLIDPKTRKLELVTEYDAPTRDELHRGTMMRKGR